MVEKIGRKSSFKIGVNSVGNIYICICIIGGYAHKNERYVFSMKKITRRRVWTNKKGPQRLLPVSVAEEVGAGGRKGDRGRGSKLVGLDRRS